MPLDYGVAEIIPLTLRVGAVPTAPVNPVAWIAQDAGGWVEATNPVTILSDGRCTLSLTIAEKTCQWLSVRITSDNCDVYQVDYPINPGWSAERAEKIDGVATTEDVDAVSQAVAALPAPPSLDGLATTEQVTLVGQAVAALPAPPDVSALATKTDVETVGTAVAALPEGMGMVSLAEQVSDIHARTAGYVVTDRTTNTIKVYADAGYTLLLYTLTATVRGSTIHWARS